MQVIAVANTKGGCGKTTVATNLAAYFAGSGHKCLLGDLDPQRSASKWLKRRPDSAAVIDSMAIGKDGFKLPKDADTVIVDCVAAMGRAVVKDVVQQADVVVVPVLPSAFDEQATKRFVKVLEDLKPIRKNKRSVLFVGNRTRSRTRSALHLTDFLHDLRFPLVTSLRDTQQYVNAAAEGLGLFDYRSARVRPYQEEWEPLLSAIRQDGQ
jgi:chromosome partitioning protein